MALTLAAETWTWYSFVILFVCFRFTSRIIHLGSIKQLTAEDYIMGFVAAIYTVLVAFMNIVAFSDTNLIAPEDLDTLTPDSINSRIYGSKLVLLVEQCMITTQWGCKICLLLLYSKLTFGLKQEWSVKIVGVYVVLSLVVMEILYFGVWCRPINQYWAVPVDNIQCSAAINHLITNAVFNISSDLMMLCIPLPLLITSQLPTMKKALLCILFSMGIFVILCAALNKYYSFSDPFSPAWTFWYIREASVAILIANIPNCWPLLRRIFRLKSFSEHSGGTGGRSTGVNLPSISAATSGGVFSHLRSSKASVAHNGRKGKANLSQSVSWGGRGINRLTKTESEEDIYDAGLRTPSSDRGNKQPADKNLPAHPMQIWQNTEVIVEEQKGNWNQAQRIKMYDGIGGGDEEQGYMTKTVVSARPKRDG